MTARIAVLVFPGTNSEDETVRLLRDCGARPNSSIGRAVGARPLRGVRASGGFRVRRSGARRRDCRARPHDGFGRRGRGQRKLVLGVCNGAQILFEAGLVPGTAAARRPTAAFTRNGAVSALHLPSRHSSKLVQSAFAVARSRPDSADGTLVPA